MRRDRRRRARLVGLALAALALAGALGLQHWARLDRPVAAPPAGDGPGPPRRAAPPATGEAASDVVISEIMPANPDVVFDETRRPADWLELHNRSDRPVPLGGWSLAQGRRMRGRWILPQLMLPPGGHLVVWASGRDLAGSAASRRVWLVLDPASPRDRAIHDRQIAVPLWSKRGPESTARRVRVSVHVPEPGAYALWITARALESPWGELRVAVDGHGAVRTTVGAGGRPRQLMIAVGGQPHRPLAAGTREVDIRALSGRVEVRHVAFARAGEADDPLALHLHTSFRIKREGEAIALIDRNGRVRDQVDPPPLPGGSSFARDGGTGGWRIAAPSPGGRPFRAAPDLAGLPSVAAEPLRVEIPRPAGIDALHFSRDGAIPTAGHPRLDGPLVLDTSGVLRVRGFAGGRPATAVATRQFWIGAPPAEPALMLAVDPALLHDFEIGILHNWLWQRRPASTAIMQSRVLDTRPPADRPGPGRLWEAAAHLLIVGPGGVAYDGAVGLQRHSDDALRLFARPSLGADHLPASLLEPPRAPPPRTLVLDPQDVVWSDVLTYDLVRLAGGIAPRARVVHALLNGAPMDGPNWVRGLATLGEVVDDRFLETRWGHSRFDLIKGRPFRVVHGSAEPFEELAARVREPGWTLADVENRVDVDDLIRIHFALAFTAPGTIDGFQGYLAFDRTAEPPRLRLIAWDADYSFLDPGYEMLRAWRGALQRNRLGYATRFLPVLMVYDLLARDARFRARYLRHAERMLNHAYTLAWWHARRRDFGWAEQPEAAATAERFFRERPAHVWRSLAALLDLPPPLPVRVTVRGRGEITVDGVPVRARYEGRYFRDGAVEVDVPAALRPALRGMTVNGTAVSALPYRRVVDEPLAIELRFAP
jgi:hypothetical protein